MKKIVIRFWPIILLFAAWFIFCIPYFFENKVPYPSEYQVNFFPPWSAYPELAGPVKNNAMPDIIDQIYPWKHFTIETWKIGQIPLWNPYSFSGTPNLANYQSAVLSPLNLLFFILPFVDAWSVLILLQPFLAGIFMYLFMRSIKVNKPGSVISSVSFMFCGFITVWMAYGTLGYAILFLPLSLFCIEKYYETQKAKFLVTLSVSIPLSFFSGHFQISLYFLFFIIVYIFYKLLARKNINNTLYIILYTVFGLFLSMPQLLPSIEFYNQSYRSDAFLGVEIMPWKYLATFLAPDFFGNPVTRNDWFGHYAEWNAYIGVIPLLLSIYAILNKKDKRTFFLFLISVLSLLLAFKSPLLELLISIKFPVLSTSSASRIIILFSFSMIVLAGIGFDKLIDDVKRRRKKPIIFWIVISLSFFVLLWFAVMPGLFIPVEKSSIARNNLILPTLFFVIISTLILLLILNKKIKLIAVYILLLVVCFDILRFAAKWQPFDPKNLVFLNVPTVDLLNKTKGFERSFGNFGGENSVYYAIPSVEGYDALYIRRYGQFIASLSDGKIKDSARSVVSFPKDGIYTPKAINLLGIKYIVHRLSDGQAPWAFPYWTYPKDSFRLVSKNDKYEIYENLNVFPRAFLVNKYQIIQNPQKIIDTMFDKSFNLQKEIVLEQDPKLKFLNGSFGTVKIIKYTPDKIEMIANSDSNSLLFLSDVYYPGWKAKINSKDTRIYRADYSFRAIYVPKGNNRVEFIYDPLGFRYGIYLVVVGIIGIVMISLLKQPKITSVPKT